MRSVHLVGIGGIGMCGLAELLLRRGCRVSGSDLRESEITGRLRELGADVRIGHAGGNVGDVDLVVHSSAVPPENPELVAARQRGIPVLRRAGLLARLAEGRRLLLVTGSHGKTSTSALLAHALAVGGLDPLAVIGGKLIPSGGTVRWGEGPHFVVEADESDGSFLEFRPDLLVVTNIDREHLDHYGSFARLAEAFRTLVGRAPADGRVILCADDPPSRGLAAASRAPVTLVGIASPESHLRAVEVGRRDGLLCFRLRAGAEDLGEVRLRASGEHMVLNSLAVIAAARSQGLPLERIRAALESFPGVERRLEVKGERRGVLVVDDYAHHPTEIRATLAAARRRWGRPCCVVFQPHRYTRTRSLLEEFARELTEADRLVLLEIYPAGERPIPGVNALALARRIAALGRPEVALAPDQDAALQRLRETLRPGDLLLTMGAGDVHRVGERFLALGEEGP
jgi:UDP-N-acetylmuramate--alanine ligase